MMRFVSTVLLADDGTHQGLELLGSVRVLRHLGDVKDESFTPRLSTLLRLALDRVEVPGPQTALFQDLDHSVESARPKAIHSLDHVLHVLGQIQVVEVFLE